MTELKCKARQAEDYTKDATFRDLQRYRREARGRDFIDTPPRGKPAALKTLAVSLYAMGDMSCGGIGRLFGASDVAVLNWIRQEAEAPPAPDAPANVEIVSLDGMRHFLKKSAKLWLWRAYDFIGRRTPAWGPGSS